VGVENETVDAEYVVGDYFPVLGVKPAAGRLIGPEDDRPGSPTSSVAVVSWPFWKNRLNLDPHILGKQIVIDKVPVTVIGVTSPQFFGLQPWSRPQVWVPVAMESALGHGAQASAAGMPLNLIGRLKPGISLEQARADLRVLFQFTVDEVSRNSQDPLWRQMTLEVEPAGAGQAFLRDQFSQPLRVLMALVGLLLLIACTSVASMLMARGAAREREMAVRVSLGAARGRLLRQVLTESSLLALAAGALGILLASYGAQWLVRTFLSGRPIVGLPPHFSFEIHTDGHVLMFTVGIALLTGLVFGLFPALRALATPPAAVLKLPPEMFSEPPVMSMVPLGKTIPLPPLIVIPLQ
jgi:predicted permease